MTPIEFTLFISAIWAAVIMLDFAYYHGRGPSVVQRIGANVLSSFGVSAIIHLGLFTAFFGAVCYIMLQFLTEYVPVSAAMWVILWTVDGVPVAVMMVEQLRTWTDETWLLRQRIVGALTKAEDIQANLDALVARIRDTADEDSSKRALLVLREISLRGDSMGLVVYNTLERNDLLTGLT